MRDFHKRCHRVMAVLAGICVLSGSASAQSRQSDAPTPNEFNFSFALSERYNSNINYQSEDADPEGDYTTDLSAQLSASRSSKRTDWSLGYRPFFTRRRDSEDQNDNRTSHNLDSRGRYSLSKRVNLSLFERFFYTEDQVQAFEPGVGESFVVTSTTAWRLQTSAGADLDVDLSRTVALRISADGSVDRNEEIEGVNFADSDSYSGGIGLVKKVGPNTQVSAAYNYSAFSIERVDGSGNIPDSASQGVGMNWSFSRPERYAVSVSGGVTSIDQEGETDTNFVGGVSYRRVLRRGVNFSSSYRRSLGGNSGRSNVNVSQNVTAGFSGKVGRRLDLGVFADYGTRNSVLESGPGTGAEEVDLTFIGGALRSRWSLNDRFGLSAEARYRNQDDSSPREDDLTVYTFSVGIVYKVF